MRFFISCFTLAAIASSAIATEWKITDDSPDFDPASPIQLEKKIIAKEGESGFFTSRKISFIWFNGKTHTFRVIDNGAGPDPTYPSLAVAMEKNRCLAICNGGFFLKDHAPSGLMIANGTSTGTFGSGGLLSGVLLSSGNRNPYLLRRREFGLKYKPTDLIQTGPFLVDGGVLVRGLSDKNARRRTFVVRASDQWFAMGLSDAFTLAELGQVLSQKGFSSRHSIVRALNLDGGTSSGLIAKSASGQDLIRVEPFKTVRNFVGIVER